MRLAVFLLSLALLAGCATTGYNPQYIVSEAPESTEVTE